MEYITTEAERAYKKRYNQKNRDMINERQKRYREEHKESIRAYQKRYSMTHDRSEYFRQRYLRKKAVNLYAQAERNERLGILPNAMQLEFQQRYVYSGSYRKETWKEYCSRKHI